MLHEKLECYRRSVRLAEELSKEGARWPRGLGYLYDQLRRAMASVVLNIAEGNARKSTAERRRFFEIARASAVEVLCLPRPCLFLRPDASNGRYVAQIPPDGDQQDALGLDEALINRFLIEVVCHGVGMSAFRSLQETPENAGVQSPGASMIENSRDTTLNSK